jgi:hypothetical protein
MNFRASFFTDHEKIHQKGRFYCDGCILRKRGRDSVNLGRRRVIVMARSVSDFRRVESGRWGLVGGDGLSGSVFARGDFRMEVSLDVCIECINRTAEDWLG